MLTVTLHVSQQKLCNAIAPYIHVVCTSCGHTASATQIENPLLRRGFKMGPSESEVKLAGESEAHGSIATHSATALMCLRGSALRA